MPNCHWVLSLMTAIFAHNQAIKQLRSRILRQRALLNEGLVLLDRQSNDSDPALGGLFDDGADGCPSHDHIIPIGHHPYVVWIRSRPFRYGRSGSGIVTLPSAF